MAEPQKLLTARYDLPESWTLAVAEKHGAYKIARRALTMMQPQQIKDEVKTAAIRGRGGAGFPAGMKWSFLAPKPTDQVYLVVNGDESEPGTFKDRSIMELDPHRLIEGCIVTCYATGAHVAYIYVRGELGFSIQRLEAAVQEARKAGYLGERPFGKAYPVQVHIHSGAGAYICGEETALLNSLEGQAAVSRA
jgi:NADH-quinone oxidoreductase subunit F